MRHTLVAVLAVCYGAFLAFVVFWPTPIDRPVAGLIARLIAELHERGVPAFIGYGFIEFAANVAMFIPVGIAFSLAVPVRWWFVTLLCGPALSVVIELTQRQLFSERYASIGDVVANSIGATVGVCLALAVRAAVAHRDRLVIARHEALTRRLDPPPLGSSS
ncbi:VanZ family protein [Microbacterium aurum]